MASAPLLDRPFRIATVALLIGGIGLAAIGLIAALAHGQTGQAVAYLLVIVMLSAAAVAVWRQVRWVTMLCLIGLGGQAVAAVATIWELTHSIAHVKVAQLHAIGINPTIAVIINAIYSAIACTVVCIFAARQRAARRRFSANPGART
jgi:hypothetical protein